MPAPEDDAELVVNTNDFRRGHRKRFAMAMTVGIALSGCGAPVAECALDSDCDQSQACEASACVPVCVTAEDCLQGEVCLQGTTTQLDVCQGEMEAGRGEPLGATLVMVRDTSEADCDATAPGADLAFVLLEDSNGAVVGWGEVVASSIEGESNERMSISHIAGMPPAAGADSCPEPSDESLVALGCGGYAAIRFLDGERVVELRSDVHTIRVGERGAQCDDEAEDNYDVFLCPNAASGDDVPDLCNAPVGSGSGERAFIL